MSRQTVIDAFEDRIRRMKARLTLISVADSDDDTGHGVEPEAIMASVQLMIEEVLEDLEQVRLLPMRLGGDLEPHEQDLVNDVADCLVQARRERQS